MKAKVISLLMLGSLLTLDTQAFYNAQQGRWVSRDPIEELGGDNLYAFVDNDSISFSDYLGLLDPIKTASDKEKTIWDCSKGSCSLVQGQNIALYLKYSGNQVKLDMPKFIAKVAESLKWTYNNLMESGFYNYGPDSFSDLGWNTTGYEVMQRYKASYEKSELERIRTLKLLKDRVVALSHFDETIKKKLLGILFIDSIKGNTCPINTMNDETKKAISNYHSHPFTQGYVADEDGLGGSDTDMRVLQVFNLRDGLERSVLRNAFISKPSSKSACAPLFEYTTSSLPKSTGVLIKYRD